MRSAIEPETIVAAVAQNTVWKMSVVQLYPSPTTPSAKKSKPPNRPFIEPNIMPKPTSQKIGVPRLKSIRFFMMMLPAFFARVKPVSTIAKPACMKNTSAAAISVQPTSIEVASALKSIDKTP